MTPIAELVRQHDPDRFLAALFAPEHHRETLLVLCAFNHELARAREVASQPMLALIRLQWWREVVQGERRRHEVAGPLGAAIDAGALQVDDLMAMIDAREVECDDTVPDLAAWHRYLAGSAGGLAVAAGRVLGADEALLDRLRALGAAYGVAGQIASVTTLAHQHRCMLPADILGAEGLTPDHVTHDPTSAARVTPRLAAEGLRLIRQAGGLLPRTVIAAALPAILARRDLWRGGVRVHRARALGDKLAVLRAAVLGRV